MNLYAQSKGFVKDIFANPDGSYSTKRTAGWVCLFISAIVSAFLLYKQGDNEVISLSIFGGYLGAFLGAMGISTVDTKSYLNAQSSVINNQQPVIPPAPMSAEEIKQL